MRHLHAVLLLTLLTVLLLHAVLLRLARHLAHVIICRLAQLLHQLGNLLIRGAVAHRFAQTLLRAAHAFQRVGQIAFFQQNGQIPKRLGNLFLHVGGEPDPGLRFKPTQDHPEAQIGRFIAKEIVRAMRDRAQHLRDPPGVLTRPEQIPALFRHRRSQRVKETPCGKRGRKRLCHGFVFGGIHRAECDQHGKIGPRVLGKILDQRFGEICAIPGNRHGQRDHNLFTRFWVKAQPVTAIHCGQIQSDPRLARLNRIVIARGEGQRHLAQRAGGGEACQLHKGRSIWCHLHSPAVT